MAKAHRICSIPDCGKPLAARGWCSAHYYRWKHHGDPLGGGTSPNALLKWIDEVALKYDGKECLIWPFGTGPEGYGALRLNGKTTRAHRYICTIVHGEPPTLKHQSAHSCGKGHLGCVNPNHLSWKTAKGNAGDRLLHGTENRGERHGASKLTETDVIEIMEMRGAVSQRGLATRFGVSQSNISQIQTRKRWHWL